MARRTETFTVTAEGRDKGKQFLLTEMPASQAENWANRLIFAAGAQMQGTNVPFGLGGLYTVLGSIGIHAFLKMDWLRAEPLLAEMFGCIKFVADPTRPESTTRNLLDDDIEEIATRWELRERVISLHLGFSLADKLWTFLRTLSAQIQDSLNTPTSLSPSGGSSQAGSQPSTS